MNVVVEKLKLKLQTSLVVAEDSMTQEQKNAVL